MNTTPGILSGTPASDKWLNYVRAVLPTLDTISDSVSDILATGILTNQGPYAQAFEEALSDRFGLPHVAVVGNATIGLMLALHALNMPAGGEVIVPTFTFAATADAIVWSGFKPVFADVDPDTMCVDVTAVIDLITPETVAIMPVHPFGGFCDVDAFDALGQERGIKIIYDSAQAAGICYKNRPVGSFGDVEVFSMHATKILPVGEGGFISSNDPAIIEQIRSDRNFGLPQGGVSAGLNGKITEFAAILGLQNLPLLQAHITHRTHMRNRIYDKLSGIPGIIWQEMPAGLQTNHQNLAIRIDADAFGLNADEVATALKHDNINARRYFHPCLHQMPAFAHCRRGPLTNSALLTQQALSLPLYSDMTEAEADLIGDAVQHVYQHATAIRAKIDKLNTSA